MNSFRIILLSVACLTLGACNDYLERKDTITFSAGDAVASNAAVQIPDPWPRHSQNVNIPMDGVKAERAIERYRGNGRNAQPSGDTGGAALVGAAAGAGAAAAISGMAGGASGSYK